MLIGDEEELKTQGEEVVKKAPSTASSGGGSGSTQTKKRQISNNVGNIRTNNERFLYMFREAMRRFRIPQYGYEKRIKDKDPELWKLSHPQLVNNSYIVYHISGRDDLGPF